MDTGQFVHKDADSAEERGSADDHPYLRVGRGARAFAIDGIS